MSTSLAISATLIEAGDVVARIGGLPTQAQIYALHSIATGQDADDHQRQLAAWLVLALAARCLHGVN